MAKAIGIDLGTTNSCAAIMDGARPRVITYKGGESTIPSVFAIDDKGNRHPLQVKPGDRVVFTSYAGEAFQVSDQELLLMREDDILAVLG